MNKIESGLKLDFNNVLIRPKCSTLNSRSEADLTRKFIFKNARRINTFGNELNPSLYDNPVEWRGFGACSSVEIGEGMTDHTTSLPGFETIAGPDLRDGG